MIVLALLQYEATVELGRRPQSDEVNWSTVPATTATTAQELPSGGIVLLCVAAWAVPGAGHFWLGRRSRE